MRVYINSGKPLRDISTYFKDKQRWLELFADFGINNEQKIAMLDYLSVETLGRLHIIDAGNIGFKVFHDQANRIDLFNRIIKAMKQELKSKSVLPDTVSISLSFFAKKLVVKTNDVFADMHAIMTAA